MDFSPEIFFLIILSGFITVWTFRHFTGSKKSGDFEYLALSAFWGLINIVILELSLFNDQERILKVMQNSYAGGLLLCLYGFGLGLFGARSLKAINQVISEKKRKAKRSK